MIPRVSYWWILAAVLLPSCSHYRLGVPAEPDFGSVHIESVVNDSNAPQVQALLTRNLIAAFLRDGTVRVGSRDSAAATLRVVVSGYGRTRSATRSNDTVLARSYNLNLSAEITLLNNHSGQPYFENRPITAIETAYVDDGLPQAEYEAMPALAIRLADRIKDAVIGVW